MDINNDVLGVVINNLKQKDASNFRLTSMQGIVGYDTWLQCNILSY